MADVNVLMPDLGNEITEAQIDGWQKAVGETVKAGEMLLSVTTPKVTLEIESPANGVLKQIVVGADELASVGAVLGVIAAD